MNLTVALGEGGDIKDTFVRFHLLTPHKNA